jgi:predicted dehydrogenase
MLKGAIAGFGKIARTNHLSAYNDEAIRNKIELAAIVEPDAVNRGISSKEFPQYRFYKSIDELLTNEKVDFVDITAPPRFHKTLLEKCIDNGLHIICEKPFTLNIAEAADIREKLLKSSVAFIPCHQYKYSPVWNCFKELIDGQKAGSRFLVQFNVFRKEADPGLHMLHNKWRTLSPKEGGGVLIDTGIHYLYLAYWMLGKPISIMANLSNLLHENYACEDTAIINYVTPKGVAEITVTWAANNRYNDARLISGNTGLFYEGRNSIRKIADDKEYSISMPDVSDKSHYTSLYVSLLQEFLEIVKGNKDRELLIEEAYQSINILNQCYKSAGIEVL